VYVCVHVTVVEKVGVGQIGEKSATRVPCVAISRAIPFSKSFVLLMAFVISSSLLLVVFRNHWRFLAFFEKIFSPLVIFFNLFLKKDG